MPDYIYTRKSRHLGDADDPHLLSHHIAALKLLAARDGVTIPESSVRTEIGSGESIAGRPVFAALLREWQALSPGCGGAVYVTEPSRLSRGSNEERGRIQDALIRARIFVVSPEKRYDPANSSDQLLWSVVQAVDQNEKDRCKARVALRRAEMTRAGEVLTGTQCFGYRWVKSPGQTNGRKIPGHLETDGERFDLLVTICREVLTTSITRLATRYGVQYGILQDTLHNPVICGFPAKRYGPHHGTKPWQESHCLLPPEQWIWPESPGNYPAACTRAEWDAIQAVIAERHTLKLKTGRAVDHGWCRPVVAFTGQPGPVKLSSVKLFRGMVPTYACPRFEQSPLYVEREPVHERALAALRALCTGPMVAGLRLLMAEQAARPAIDGEPLRRRLKQERERYAVLKGELANPALDDEERLALGGAERECRRRLDRLKEEVQQAARVPTGLPDLATLLPGLDELAAEFDGAWARMPGTERQEIVVALVKEIAVTVIPGKRGVRWEREIGKPALMDWLGKV